MRRSSRTALAGLIAAALTAAPVTAAQAAPADSMADAMQRDLGLAPAAAEARLAAELTATDLETTLRGKLGARFGGAWVDGLDHRLVVATTDPAQVAAIEATGAKARLVARTEVQLTAAKDRLDRTPASKKITSWYVDAQRNTVVVTAQPGATAEAATFAAQSGLAGAGVTVETSAERPVPHYDVRGGDAYYPGGRCSIGFAVKGGFVTAGHCGDVGDTTDGYNGVAQGTVKGSSFPGNDYGWVAVNNNWTPTPRVNRYPGSVVVTGTSSAAVGAAVCRSGSTTGWRCGVVTAKNVTVNYEAGQVSGLTKTDACAEGGDSGGSWLAGRLAQGVHSGGTGSCTGDGNYTVFQPIGEILTKYNLTLTIVKAARASLNCESGLNQYRCPAVISGDAPVTTKWYVNGAHVPSNDNKTFLNGNCTAATTVKVTATNAGGSSSSSWGSCRSGPWL
jgi:streptogrisin C